MRVASAVLLAPLFAALVLVLKAQFLGSHHYFRSLVLTKEKGLPLHALNGAQIGFGSSFHCSRNGSVWQSSNPFIRAARETQNNFSYSDAKYARQVRLGYSCRGAQKALMPQSQSLRKCCIIGPGRQTVNSTFNYELECDHTFTPKEASMQAKSFQTQSNRSLARVNWLHNHGPNVKVDYTFGFERPSADGTTFFMDLQSHLGPSYYDKMNITKILCDSMRFYVINDAWTRVLQCFIGHETEQLLNQNETFRPCYPTKGFMIISIALSLCSGPIHVRGFSLLNDLVDSKIEFEYADGMGKFLLEPKTSVNLEDYHRDKGLHCLGGEHFFLRGLVELHQILL